MQQPEHLQKLNAFPVIKDPVSGFVGVTLLTHQLSFFNILPLYNVLLVLLPLTLSVHRLDWRLLLALSAILYVLTGLYLFKLPSFPAENTWYFNPLAWQLLIVIGFIWGARIRARRGIPNIKPLFWSAVAYLILALIWKQMPSLWPFFPKSDAFGALWGFSKTFLSPFQLLHILALAYVIAMSPLGRWMTRISATNPIVQMGQHALPIFCVGSLLSVCAWLIRTQAGGGVLVLTIAILLGPPALAGQVVLGFVPSPNLGRAINYQLYLPDGYGDGVGRFEIVYLLHGAAGNERTWMKLGKIKTTVDRLIASKAIPPVIVAMPGCRRCWWVDGRKDKAETALWNDFVPSIERRFRTTANSKGRFLQAFQPVLMQSSDMRSNIQSGSKLPPPSVQQSMRKRHPTFLPPAGSAFSRWTWPL